MSSRAESQRLPTEVRVDGRTTHGTGEPNFVDLVDVVTLQSMMDSFYMLTRIPTAVVDLEGVVVVSSGWQDVCTRFHRTNPETCINCIESDTVLTADIPAGESRLYQCKNGMWDAAMPVVVGVRHIANVFTGQFFFDDTPVDTEYFRAQGKRYGFDEDEYISAVSNVPRLSRSTVRTGLRFLTELSSMISRQGLLALENARLYEIEHEIAQTLQETLVVLPAQVAGIAFSRAYESATSQPGNVGGDFVDVFHVIDDTVCFALGDVSGKGVDAAVITSLIRTTLRVHALDGLSVGQVASKTNRMMLRFTETDSFVTLWFGLLDTKTGALRYICAGHPPALVMASDGSMQQLKGSDTILGAFDHATYCENVAFLSPGDRLILYTDGAIEARSPEGDFLNEEGLVEVIRNLNDLGASDLSQGIMDAVRAHSHGVLQDDVAILTVEGLELRAAPRDVTFT